MEKVLMNGEKNESQIFTLEEENEFAQFMQDKEKK